MLHRLCYVEVDHLVLNFLPSLKRIYKSDTSFHSRDFSKGSLPGFLLPEPSFCPQQLFLFYCQLTCLMEILFRLWRDGHILPSRSSYIVSDITHCFLLMPSHCKGPSWLSGQQCPLSQQSSFCISSFLKPIAAQMFFNNSRVILLSYTLILHYIPYVYSFTQLLTVYMWSGFGYEPLKRSILIPKGLIIREKELTYEISPIT